MSCHGSDAMQESTMFSRHVGKGCEKHFGRKPPYIRRAFSHGCQIPMPAGQHFGDAKQLTAPELSFHRMAITVENLNQSGFDQIEMRCHLAGPKQGLAMEKRNAGNVLHTASARQPPLCHLGGNRA